MIQTILEVSGLAKLYPVRRGVFRPETIGSVRAVDGVSFRLTKGETLGLVGESSCGKSTLARLIMRLIEPSSGVIRLEGKDITNVAGESLRRLRRRMQMVFQDPLASLNPRMTIRAILEEPLIVNQIGDSASRRARVTELLSLVGLAAYHADRRPHEFSGGQRQRIGIARALAVEPSLIVCDEPVSALDVSIQAQIVNLLKDLQEQLGLSYLFIAHDLAIVKHMANRVAVMYLGRIVEIGPKGRLFAEPRHPYTRALIEAVPEADPHRVRKRVVVTGETPSPMAVMQGCRFHTRCPLTTDLCRQQEPPIVDFGDGHYAACHQARTLPPFVIGEAASISPRAAKRLALYEERLRKCSQPPPVKAVVGADNSVPRP